MQAVVAVASSLPAHLQPEIERAQQFIRNRHSDATRRAYAADAIAFNKWAQQKNVPAIPASAEVVALFLSEQALLGKKPATLARRLAAIRYLHREAGLPTPTDAEVVKSTLAGIKRTAGMARRQVAPATADRLLAMLEACNDGTLSGKRDRALLVLGFGGAFRRSELAGLRVEDLEFTDNGVKVHLARSKTDQTGEGATIAVLDGPRMRVRAALQDWMAAAGFDSGPLFRRLTKAQRALPVSVTDRSVADIVKHRADQAGLDSSGFSGHSLRAGFLTSAAAAGADLFRMMDVSRHRKVDTVRVYVRQAEQFKNHAGSAFM